MPPNRAAAAVTERFRTRLGQLRDVTTSAVTARWRRGIDLDTDDLAGMFEGWTDEAATLLTSAQLQAARIGGAYLATYLRAAGIDRDDISPPDPEKFAGVDFDGEPLDRSLTTARNAVLWQLGKGAGRTRALATGLDSAVRISRSSVMSAARGAQADVMGRDRQVAGWRRVTSSGPCGACLALAGRRQGSSESFPAHDRCRCTAEPILDGVPERIHRPDGAELLRRMSDREKARLFAGRGGAEKAARIDPDDLDRLVSSENGRIYETPLTRL